MKTILLGLFLLGFAGNALAIAPSELDARIQRLTGMFETLQSKPDKAIPPELLRNAQGIVLLDRTKAGFLFAYQGGVGVAMIKDPSTHQWSAPAFLSANDASLGFQVGGEQSFNVILLMSQNAARALAFPVNELGSEARGTVGNLSGGAQSTASPLRQEAVVYNDRVGFFGGADLKSGTVTPDNDANIIYYGQPLSMSDILLWHKVKPTAAGAALVKVMTDYSKAETAPPPTVATPPPGSRY